MSECKHSSYWRGIYATCMVCRAEQAEAKIAQLEAEKQELSDTFTLHIGMLKSSREAYEQLRAECERLRQQAEITDDLLQRAHTIIGFQEAAAPTHKGAAIRRAIDAQLTKEQP